MYSSIAALTLLGFGLAWAALNRSGIPAFDWYISLISIGLASIAFWIRNRRILCPSLPTWLIWIIRGFFLFLLLQAIPLPLPLLDLLSPVRAELTRSAAKIAGPISYAPISVDPAAHILWSLTIAGCAAAFFLVRNLTFRFQNRQFLAILPLLLVSTFEAVLGLLQIAGGAEQAMGSYNSRDHYCCILEITLPVTVAFGLYYYAERIDSPTLWPVLKAVGCWAMAALLTLGILFSLSRAGWIDSLLSLLLLAVLVSVRHTSSNGWRLGILAGLLVLVLAIFIIASPASMLTRLVATATPDAEARTYIWRNLVPLTRDFRWFGAGLMGFDPTFLKYQKVLTAARIDFAHNDFLQYLIELGVVGFLILMSSLGGVIWPFAKGSWRIRSEYRVLLIGCVAGAFALFVHSLVDFNLYIPANMFAFAWVLGFGSAIAAVSEAAKTSNPRDVPEEIPR